MTRLLSCLVLAVLFAPSAKLQNQPPMIGAGQRWVGENITDNDVKILVSGEIVEQAYCNGGSGFFSDTLTISLRFNNLAEHNAILSRKIPAPIVVRVAKNSGDLRAGRFEYNPSVDLAVAEVPKSPSLGSVPASEQFAIVPPNETFETRVSAVIFVTQTRRKGFVGAGKHVLQLGVETWPYQWPYYTSINPRGLVDEWKKYGRLVTGLLYTEPMAFSVPAKVKGAPCL